MGSSSTYPPQRIVEYDAIRRRLWILGQRCHHGAAGSVVTTLACVGYLGSRGHRSLLAVAATGGVLVLHDWKDHAVWFRRGA